MTLLILSFFAGVLTVAAPCILPLLPIIIGGSAASDDEKRNWVTPLIITSSLAISVVIFSLLLKASTVLLGVPQEFWNLLSGVIVSVFGISLLFPQIREVLSLKTGLNTGSNRLLGKFSQRKGLSRNVLMGAALGPVFSSCSPTYALIVAVILPASFLQGLAFLTAYAIGLASILLLIAIGGQAVVKKLGWASDPHGWFRKIVGILFIVVGVSVIFGLDRQFQAFVLDKGWYDPILQFEQSLGL